MHIELKSCTDVDPMDLASYAAKVCYTSELPEWGKRLNVEKNLFQTGHHTTLEHFYLSYVIEGIAVGDITFGLHLTHPFYNTDQRSGRYAGKMFANPDFDAMEDYVKKFWPEVYGPTLREVIDYVKFGANIYSDNMPKAQEVVAKFIAEDRPYASNNIRANIPKFAQEQMRNFISILFPTASVFTIDIITLVSMYESAWTPVMRYVTGEMARLFVGKFPEVKFLFNEDRRRKDDWAIICDEKIDTINVSYRPDLHNLSISGDGCTSVDNKKMHPVDNLHFTPELMRNSVDSIRMEIEISLATMGQDQRHRTISRGEPFFTGNFYVPPVLQSLSLADKALEYMRKWKEITESVPDTLAMILAPYGAMVAYEKSGSFNGIAHEQCKRTCFCAQPEIYDVARQERIAIEKVGGDPCLLEIFQPPCFKEGKCGEGDRYCGRDIGLRKTGDYFPERRV